MDEKDLLFGLSVFLTYWLLLLATDWTPWRTGAIAVLGGLAVAAFVRAVR